MEVAEARVLYEFNRWANRRVIGAIGALREDEFRRDLGNSFPSVRDTLVHILAAEWSWLERWSGNTPGADPDHWPALDLDGVRKELEAVEERQIAFVRSLDADAMRRDVRYRSMAGDERAEPLGWLLRHVVNHSSYHRGQIVTMLRQLGAPAVATDLVLFYREHVRVSP